MATHSRILAWEVLWTREPGRLQSMRLQRVGRDLATKSPLPPAPQQQILELYKEENHGFPRLMKPWSSFSRTSVGDRAEEGKGIARRCNF